MRIPGASSPGGGQQPAAANTGSGQCEIYDSGYDARIVVLSGGQGECQTLASSLSSGGDFWTFQPQNATDQLSMVCVMDNSGDQAEVIDGGGQIIGHDVCSGMLSSGWTEDTSAEGQIQQQELQAQQAQASASASAAASQAQAQCPAAILRGRERACDS